MGLRYRIPHDFAICGALFLLCMLHTPCFCFCCSGGLSGLSTLNACCFISAFIVRVLLERSVDFPGELETGNPNSLIITTKNARQVPTITSFVLQLPYSVLIKVWRRTLNFVCDNGSSFALVFLSTFPGLLLLFTRDHHKRISQSRFNNSGRWLVI